MEDEELTQTGSEELPDESAGDSLDDILGSTDEEEGSSQDEDQDTTKEEKAEAPVDKEEKKQRDFEKAFYKEKELRKQAEAKVKVPVDPESGKPEMSEQDKQGLDLLQDMINKAVEPIIAPIKEQSDRAFLQEFKQQPYVDVLEKQILSEYHSMDRSGDLKKDLETARKAVISDNIDTIVQSAISVGQKDGFKNRSFKQGQAPIRETARSGAKNDIFDRYESGDLSSKELAEHQDEIDEYESDKFGVSRVNL